MRYWRRQVLVVAVGLVIFAVACATPEQLPSEAENALEAYWQSLPADPALNYKITAAWPGDVSAAEVTAATPDIEVWCVEAEVTAAADESIIGEPILWLVTRTTATAPWQAAMLATMSSTWPYEACGQPLS